MTHPMNWPPLPTRSKQLVERGSEESAQAYKARCWDAEFRLALSEVTAPGVRNALWALRHMMKAPEDTPDV